MGDLHRPDVPRPAVVVLLHGGFWRMPYGRDETTPVALSLAARGFAVWNLEYGRVGAPGGGWPGTLEDVATGIDHLARLADEGIVLDLGRVIVAGHSAGGQLALWSASRGRGPAIPRPPERVRPAAAAALGAVLDLREAFELGLGGDAVGALLGGSPNEWPERYATASPLALLPIGVPQLVVHGALDDAVPVRTARRYADAAAAAGDEVEFHSLTRIGHMDHRDPASEAHAPLCAWLERITRAAPA